MSPKTLRSLLGAAAIVAAGLLVTVILVKTASRPERQVPPPSRPVVMVHEVAVDQEPVRIRGFGSVKAKRSVELVAEVRGRVVMVSPRLEPGAYVSAGEALLRLDDTDYALAAAQARANVAQAEVTLAQAEEEVQVARREWEQLGAAADGAAAGEPGPLVLRLPQLNLARAGLEAARAALRQAEVNLSRCTLTAPFDGRVRHADLDVGDFVAAGAGIGSIHATDLAEVTVPAADADLAWIAIGRQGDRDLPVEVGADFAGARHTWPGRAVRLGGVVDARSRQVPVIVEIPDPYRDDAGRPALVEGMFVEVTFSTPPPAGAVVIPRIALRPDDIVWVVAADGKLSLRKVTVARADIEQAIVTAGLAAGERVCVSALQYVTDGMEVQVGGDR